MTAFASRSRICSRPCYDAQGIGLAATQVDFHERLIVIDVSQDRDQKLVLINPEILWASEEKQVGERGCLSVPGIYDGVERSTSVKVRALDENGNSREIEAEGLLAICIQHEMDHLLGKVFRGIPLAPQAQPHQDQDDQRCKKRPHADVAPPSACSVGALGSRGCGDAGFDRLHGAAVAKPGTPTSAIVAGMGQPQVKVPLEGGGERWVYSRQPAGQQVYHMVFDAQQRLRSVEQVLDEAHFQRLRPGA